LPRIDFVAEAEQCPGCGGALRVQKSQRRTVVTVCQGTFEAREIRKQCMNRSCPPTRSEALRRLVKPGQRYSYDLLVHVGLGRYLAGQQRDEIRRQLSKEHGIELSAGTVSMLCDRFLSLIEALHVQRAPQLRAAQPGGSYPLHLDATCEHGKGGLFVCMDGWRGWVLWAARVPTENAVHLTPVVDRTVELFGRPIAVVRDMGDGGAHAVAALHQAGVPDLICHYHFAAAVGTNLFDKLYDHLRGIIRLSKIRTDLFALLRELRPYDAAGASEGRWGPGSVREDLKALVLWVLQGDGRKDAPYPFALPHLELVRRCRQSLKRAEQWIPSPRTQLEHRVLAWLGRRIGRLERDPRLAATVESLEQSWRTFVELRDVLRLSNAELPRGDTRLAPRQLPALELLRLEQIKQAVERFRDELCDRIPPAERGQSRPSSAPAIVLKYLERNQAHLFGHPAHFDPDGRVVAVVDRTNNVLEQFFGQDKQRLRRRVGRAQLGHDLEQQPAQVALVANLRHADYVQILCGSLEQLPAALAALDMQSSVAPASPVREQRDKALHQRVQKLLATTDAPSGTGGNGIERHGPPQLEPVDLPQRWPQLESLSEDDLRARCIGVFAPSDNTAPKRRDPRLPPSGTVLKRRFKSRTHRVTVLDTGFEYRGEHYAALSPIAKAITGTTPSGFRFFRLDGPWGEPRIDRRRRRYRRPPGDPTAAATES